jgi:hypothetical protein
MDISTLFHNILNLLLQTQLILEFSNILKIPNRVELWEIIIKEVAKEEWEGEHD